MTRPHTLWAVLSRSAKRLCSLACMDTHSPVQTATPDLDLLSLSTPELFAIVSFFEKLRGGKYRRARSILLKLQHLAKIEDSNYHSILVRCFQVLNDFQDRHYLQKGDSLLKRQAHDPAVRAYEQIPPERVESWDASLRYQYFNNKGLALLQAGRDGEGLSALHAAFNSKPSPGAKMHVALGLMSASRYREAMTVLKDLRPLCNRCSVPSNACCDLCLAFCLCELDRLVEAENLFNKVPFTFPGKHDIDIYRLRRLVGRAIECQRIRFRAVVFSPTSPPRLSALSPSQSPTPCTGLSRIHPHTIEPMGSPEEHVPTKAARSRSQSFTQKQLRLPYTAGSHTPLDTSHGASLVSSTKLASHGESSAATKHAEPLCSSPEASQTLADEQPAVSLPAPFPSRDFSPGSISQPARKSIAGYLPWKYFTHSTAASTTAHVAEIRKDINGSTRYNECRDASLSQPDGKLACDPMRQVYSPSPRHYQATSIEGQAQSVSSRLQPTMAPLRAYSSFCHGPTTTPRVISLDVDPKPHRHHHRIPSAGGSLQIDTDCLVAVPLVANSLGRVRTPGAGTAKTAALKSLVLLSLPFPSRICSQESKHIVPFDEPLAVAAPSDRALLGALPSMRSDARTTFSPGGCAADVGLIEQATSHPHVEVVLPEKIEQLIAPIWYDKQPNTLGTDDNKSSPPSNTPQGHSSTDRTTSAPSPPVVDSWRCLGLPDSATSLACRPTPLIEHSLSEDFGPHFLTSAIVLPTRAHTPPFVARKQSTTDTVDVLSSSPVSASVAENAEAGKFVSFHVSHVTLFKEKALYPIERLRAPGPYPEDVDIAHRELHLSDDEFANTMGLTKDHFRALSGWKQAAKKKAVGLF